MKATKENITNYLIDCIGLSEEDCENSSKAELWAEMPPEQRLECLAYNL